MKQIDKILEELYTLDPKLKNKEKELTKIIEKLLATKPDVKIDETFVTNLRRELLNSKIKVRPSLTSFVSFMRKKPVYITGSIIAVLVLIVSFGYLNLTGDRNLVFKNFDDQNIVSTKPGSFGSLAGVFHFDGQEEALKRAPQNLSAGAGGGGGVAVSESYGVADSREIGIFAPSYKQYVFKYVGGDFGVDADEMPVFKRIKGHPASTGLVSTIYKQVKSMVDLSSLDNMQVETIRMTQNTNDGYGVTINPKEGVVSMERMTGRYAVAEIAPDPYRHIPSGEMPSNEEIINIANKFFGKLGISRSGYGEPYVNESWKEMQIFDEEAGVESSYVPPVISVVYPIAIEGNETYDQSGNKRGLQVNVNVNGKYVQNVWNLTTEKYESSNYAITDDSEKIIKFAEQGGAYPSYYGDNAEIITLNLGQPELIYVLQHKYGGDEASSEELYIPAFKFPILNAPSEYYGRKAIVIPIVKEILDGYGNNDGITPRPPMIEPMILEESTRGDEGATDSVEEVEAE